MKNFFQKFLFLFRKNQIVYVVMVREDLHGCKTDRSYHVFFNKIDAIECMERNQMGAVGDDYFWIDKSILI